jgi:hypothetical protein
MNAKKTFTSQISQKTLLKGVFLYKRLCIIILTSSEECDQGSSNLSVVGKHLCHNLNLGFTTKARACKGAGQEGSPRVTFHAPGSVGECEGMNLHIPK